MHEKCVIIISLCEQGMARDKTPLRCFKMFTVISWNNHRFRCIPDMHVAENFTQIGYSVVVNAVTNKDSWTIHDACPFTKTRFILTRIIISILAINHRAITGYRRRPAEIGHLRATVVLHGIARYYVVRILQNDLTLEVEGFCCTEVGAVLTGKDILVDRRNNFSSTLINGYFAVYRVGQKSRS